MASFSTAVRPTIERPHGVSVIRISSKVLLIHLIAIDEDAVDLTETIDLSGPARPRKNTSAVERDGSYELHSLQPYVGERIRRPSAVRLESSATMSFKDGASEPSTPAFERSDSLKNAYNSTATALPGLQGTGIGNLTGAISVRAQAVNAETSKKMRRTSRWQFFALCWCFFLNGWNDGTTGPLLPVIQEHYGVCDILPLVLQYT